MNSAADDMFMLTVPAANEIVAEPGAKLPLPPDTRRLKVPVMHPIPNALLLAVPFRYTLKVPTFVPAVT